MSLKRIDKPKHYEIDKTYKPLIITTGQWKGYTATDYKDNDNHYVNYVSKTDSQWFILQ